MLTLKKNHSTNVRKCPAWGCPCCEARLIANALRRSPSRSLNNQAVRFGVVIIAIFVLSAISPYNVQATVSGEQGTQVSLNGVLYFAYGSESCATQQVGCTPGESVIPYLTLRNGLNYIILGGNAGIWPEGTTLLVTGWVIPPTGSAPLLSFAGDIIVTNIHTHCHMHQ
jgi:hypothetical protein